MEAVLFIGIQGSGKTTFYRERLFDTHVRLSRDMLKTRNRELLLVRACLAARQAFVVDDTNASASTRAESIEAARGAGFRVVGYYFRTPLRTAFARNRRRPPGQVIPVPGVLATFKRFQPPVWAEGFDELRVVEVSGEHEISVRPWTREEGDPPGLERE
jgi:tRNA uridine 5-carbamoylmethylation protein Kti12